MASGASEFPGSWLVEDLAVILLLGRDHAGLRAPGPALAALWAR